jgi:CheY-like chemotaxis protein/anti-sigma regulatory factor (Ser/Thr protein kinase)
VSAARRSGGRVLVVEDDPAGRELLEQILADDGYTVEALDDGAEAWRRLEAGAPGPDVVLLDWSLPGLDGLEVLRRIRADDRFEALPVVFQTGRTDPDAMMSAFDAGASYFVPKPVDRQLLRTVVAAAVEDHARNRNLHETVRKGAAAALTLERGEFRFRTIEEASALATLLSQACPDPEQVVVGLGELLINAVEHGNLGITYEEKSALLAAQSWAEEVARRLAAPEHRDKTVEVLFERAPDRIVITIADRGPGFDWQRFLTVAPERIFHAHGRGIAMANLMSFDRLEYVAPGNRVIATVELGENGE